MGPPPRDEPVASPSPGQNRSEGDASSVSSASQSRQTWIKEAIDDHLTFLVFVALLAGLSFGPILVLMHQGVVFGPDVTEYLFTAHNFLDGTSSTFSYPYPLLPLLYTPVVLTWPGFLSSYQVGDVSLGFVLLFLGICAYAFFRRISSSSLAAAIGATAVVTQPLLLSEAGWTGLAQFVAIGLGLLGLTTLIRYRSESRVRFAGLTGVLLILSTLSEPYSAAYFVVAGIFYSIFAWRLKMLSPRVLGGLALAFVPALVGGLSLDLAYPQLAQSGLHQLVINHLGNEATWHWMFTVFVQSNWYLWGIYAIAIGVFLLLRLRYGGGFVREPVVLPALLVALVPQTLVLTPLFSSNRAIYFAAIPLALVLARLAQMSRDSRAVFEAVERDSTPTAGTTTARDTPTSMSSSLSLPLRLRSVKGRYQFAGEAIGALVISVLVIGAQGGLATHDYPAALKNYSESPGVLEQLTWLRGQSGGVVYVGPDNQLFPVEFAMERPIFPAVQPKILNTASQQDAAILGNTIAYGVNWLDAGQIVLTDSEPVWSLPAPAIFVSEAPYYVQLLRLSDAFATARYSPLGSPTTIYNVSLSGAPSRSSSIIGNALVDTFAYPRVSVVRTTTVDSSGLINITLNYRFQDAIVRGLGLDVISPQVTVDSASIATVDGDSVVLLHQSYWLNSGTRVVTTYSTSETISSPGMAQSSKFVSSNQYGLPAVQTGFVATNGSVLNYTVTILLSIFGITPGPIVPVTESSALVQDGIHWAVVAKGVDSNVINRFLHDPMFTLYLQSEDYDFFEVT